MATWEPLYLSAIKEVFAEVSTLRGLEVLLDFYDNVNTLPAKAAYIRNLGRVACCRIIDRRGKGTVSVTGRY